MTQKNVYVIIGFMLFALFFGAGNLIYPAFLGIYSGSHLFWAILGFCLTGVTLPLLGVVAVAYSGATDVEIVNRPISKWYALLFSPSTFLSAHSLPFQEQEPLPTPSGPNQYLAIVQL